jgi:NitT/TauT family transport system permease protein
LRALRWIAPIAAVLAGWELLARTGLVNPVLLSSPSQSLTALLHLLGATSPGGYPLLVVHAAASLWAFAVAFTIAAVAGLLVGTAMGASPRVYRFVDPLLTVTMPIPGIAWAPLFMLWLGFGSPTVIAVSALAAFFPVACNTATGVRSIDRTLVWAAVSMGAGQKDLLVRVCLPGATPHLLTGLRLGFARGWRTAIAVEMLAASVWGLGFLIIDAREFLRPSLLYGAVLLVGAVYLTMETLVVRRIEKRTVEKWGMTKPATERA